MLKELLFLYQSALDLEQTGQMEAFRDNDASGICPHPEAGPEGKPAHDAALHVEDARGADLVCGAAVAKDQPRRQCLPSTRKVRHQLNDD